MSGYSFPVMTTKASKNQGMRASFPIIKYCTEQKLFYKELIRALVFSHLTTIHLKTNVTRLLTYCGVMCETSTFAVSIYFIEKLLVLQK
ncbi:MAG: L-serine ammonia-lyase, iron-sulfur-dependent, subunit alpha [Campylobacteraceae bacterium]|nr:L-serine ammonia-lyase, iron-sulfur-dependent, subunit alpha [Campylobacteraceae bacterium]